MSLLDLGLASKKRVPVVFPVATEELLVFIRTFHSRFSTFVPLEFLECPKLSTHAPHRHVTRTCDVSVVHALLSLAGQLRKANEKNTVCEKSVVVGGVSIWAFER